MGKLLDGLQRRIHDGADIRADNRPNYGHSLHVKLDRSMLTPRDRQRMTGVHSHLVALVAEASVVFNEKYPDLTLFVTSGLRTREQQYELWRDCHNLDGSRNKKPWKTNLNGTPKGEYAPGGTPGTGVSNHQRGLAVDLAVNYNGRLTWQEKYYDLLGEVMLEVAAKNEIPLVWGGTFKSRKDRPHFELNTKFY